MGLAIGGHAYLGPDAAREGGSAGEDDGTVLPDLLVTFFMLFFVIKKITPNGYVLGVITVALVYAAGWLFVHYTPVDGDDNHVLSIGGGLGIVMMFNVWGIIWLNNKRIIRATLAGTAPGGRGPRWRGRRS